MPLAGRLAAACVGICLVLGAGPAPAPGQDSTAKSPKRPPTAAIARGHTPIHRTTEATGRPRTGGWLAGTAGLALVLAAVGGLSVAARRLNLSPRRETNPLEVLARTNLTPRHSVYLVRIADRILIIGAGNGGAPASLGEITDPAERARLLGRPPGEAAT